MNHIEVMKQALEALETCRTGSTHMGGDWYSFNEYAVSLAKKSLRAAIETAERTSHIKEHRAVWTGATTYSCGYCGEEFRSEHQVMHHSCDKMPPKKDWTHPMTVEFREKQEPVA